MLGYFELGILLAPWLATPIVLGLALVKLRRTTLVWPLGWAFCAWAFISGSVWVLDPVTTCYCGSVFLISPILALLGAKRPQNGAWQAIVGTMLLISLSPVIKSWAFGDSVPSIHPLFFWLIGAHILLAVGNYSTTRYGSAAVMFAVGQMMVLAAFFDARSSEQSCWYPFGIALIGLAAVFATWAVHHDVRGHGMQKLWRDFRDAYGTVWGLRVAERLNFAATKNRWPVEFLWRGIIIKNTEFTAVPKDADFQALDPEVRHRVERELRSMLRRFVSHEWIVKRLEPRAVIPETSEQRPESSDSRLQ